MDLDDQLTTAHLLLETRVCRKCGLDKNLLADFYMCRKDPTLASSYSYECKECTIKRTVRYNKENFKSVRSQYLKRSYGMTFEEFDAMLSDQGNCCAICKTKQPGGRAQRFNVDHNHKTGEVRGLLCKSCNIALGEVKENIHTLQAMIEYLNE